LKAEGSFSLFACQRAPTTTIFLSHTAFSTQTSRRLSNGVPFGPLTFITNGNNL